MKTRGASTLALAGLTLLVLAVSAPGSLQAAFERGNFYLFSQLFFEDLPKRLTGPGWFRLILQPLVAIALGLRAGLADARNGRPPYLWGVFFHRHLRRELGASALKDVVNLLLMGILLDSLFQWAILGASYPGAALVVGPVLIGAPYVVSRGLTNRIASKAKPLV